MNIFRRDKLTDEEFVEKVRKEERNLRRFWWIWPLLLVAFVYATVQFAFVVHGFADTATSYGVGVEERLVYLAVANGFMFGLLFFMFAFNAGQCLRQWHAWRHGRKTERLLLKYYDEAREQKGSNKAVEHYGDPCRVTEVHR